MGDDMVESFRIRFLSCDDDDEGGSSGDGKVNVLDGITIPLC